jgi:ribose transport system substrate-binding protein
MKKEFPDIELISTDQRAGATEEQAYRKSQNLLTRFKDEVNGIFCPNESAAAGMLGALRQAGLNGKIKFVGFDASEKLVQALGKGDIDGLVLQNPINMAYRPVGHRSHQRQEAR